MSFTKIFKSDEDKKKFREFFPKPDFRKKEMDRKILAPPIADNKPLTGTAFDYLLRFLIEYSYKHTISNRWIAENTLHLLEELIKGEKDKKKIRELKKYNTKIERIILDAKKNHSAFLSNGQITEKLCETVLLLAQVDNIIRIYEKTKELRINFDPINGNDVKDLKNLFAVVNIENFQLKDICFLNPYFGKAPNIVADADLIIGDVLIDIKTISNLEMKLKTFDQLIWYYILSRVAGINGMKNKIKIRKIGVYFSRFAHLHIYNIEDIITETKFSEFIEWFQKNSVENN